MKASTAEDKLTQRDLSVLRSLTRGWRDCQEPDVMYMVYRGLAIRDRATGLAIISARGFDLLERTPGGWIEELDVR